MSIFWTRTLSGAIYVAVVVSSILIHPMIFAGISIGLALYAVREFHHLMHSPRCITIFSMLSGALLVGLFVVIEQWEQIPLFGVKVLAMLYCSLILVSLITVLFLPYRENGDSTLTAIAIWGNILGSQVMIALPFALMNTLIAINPYILLMLFVTIWVNDSGAYCIGSFTARKKGGNHKMFPRVSPNKSWEGLVGGIVWALLAGCVYIAFDWLNMQSWQVLIFVVLISVFGTIGDLMESLMKRTIGIKDSGSFLPGHGGVLDRFDSILLATPVIYLFTILVM